MTALTSDPACLVTRKLIALLEERPKPCSAERSSRFAEGLASLEIEAIESAAAPAALMLIRVAKETMELAKRIGTRSRPV